MPITVNIIRNTNRLSTESDFSIIYAEKNWIPAILPFSKNIKMKALKRRETPIQIADQIRTCLYMWFCLYVWSVTYRSTNSRIATTTENTTQKIIWLKSIEYYWFFIDVYIYEIDIKKCYKLCLPLRIHFPHYSELVKSSLRQFTNCSDSLRQRSCEKWNDEAIYKYRHFFCRMRKKRTDSKQKLH